MVENSNKASNMGCEILKNDLNARHHKIGISQTCNYPLCRKSNEQMFANIDLVVWNFKIVSSMKLFKKKLINIGSLDAK